MGEELRVSLGGFCWREEPQSCWLNWGSGTFPRAQRAGPQCGQAAPCRPLPEVRVVWGPVQKWLPGSVFEPLSPVSLQDPFLVSSFSGSTHRRRSTQKHEREVLVGFMYPQEDGGQKANRQYFHENFELGVAQMPLRGRVVEPGRAAWRGGTTLSARTALCMAGPLWSPEVAGCTTAFAQDTECMAGSGHCCAEGLWVWRFPASLLLSCLVVTLYCTL